MNNHFLVLSRAALALAIVLTGCATPQVVPPTATPEPTPAPTATQAATPIPISRRLAEAYTALGKGDVDTAEAGFAAIIGDAPGAAAYAGLSRVYARRPDKGGRFPERVEAARKAVELDPSSVDGQTALSAALLADGDTSGALKAAQAATAGAPDASALAALALANLADFQPALALSATLKALELDPQSAEAWLALGYARAGQGDHGRAAAALGQAVSLRPDDPLYRVALARQWQAMDRYEKAEAEAIAALARNGTHLGALLALAAARGAQGYVDEAELTLKRTQELYPGSIEPILVWARTHPTSGATDVTLQKIRDGLLRFADSPALRFALIEALAVKADCAGADRESELLIADRPRDPRAHFISGVAKSCKGDLTGAIDRYRKALAINPNYAEARLALVSVLGAQDRADESDAELALAVQTAASKSTVHLASYRAAGRLGDAIQELEAALLANPRGLTLMTRLASLYADARLDASAQALANRALATWPDSVDAKLIAGQIEALSGDPVKAASLLREGLAQSPDSTRGHRYLAYALLADGKYEDAAREQKIFESLTESSDDGESESSAQPAGARLSDLLATFPLADPALAARLPELSKRLDNAKVSAVAGQASDQRGTGRVVTVTVNFTAPADSRTAAGSNREIAAAMAGISLIARVTPRADKGGVVILQAAGRTTHIVRVTQYGARDVVMGVPVRRGLTPAVTVLHPVPAGALPYAEIVSRLPTGYQDVLKKAKPFETTPSALGVIWLSRVYGGSAYQATRAKQALGALNSLKIPILGELVEPVLMFSLTGNTMRYVKRTEVSTEEQFQMIHELVYAHDELVSGGTVRGDLCIADNGDACRAVYANYNAAAAVFADRMLDGLDWYFLAGHLQGFESALFRRSPASIGDWLDGQDEPLAAMAAEQLEQDIVRMQSGQSSTTKNFPASTRQIMRHEQWGGRSAAPQNLAPVEWILTRLGAGWLDTGADRLGQMGLRQLLAERMGPVLAGYAVRDWYADSLLLARKGDGPYVTILRVNLENDENAARFAVLFRAAMEHRQEYVETTVDMIGEPASREWTADKTVVIAHRDRQFATLLLSADRDAAKEVEAVLSTR